MNVNELADYITKNVAQAVNGSETAATMLRQQALEIQALHQILGYEGIEVGKEYLDECVEDLRKAQEK